MRASIRLWGCASVLLSLACLYAVITDLASIPLDSTDVPATSDGAARTAPSRYVQVLRSNAATMVHATTTAYAHAAWMTSWTVQLLLTFVRYCPLVISATAMVLLPVPLFVVACGLNVLAMAYASSTMTRTPPYAYALTDTVALLVTYLCAVTVAMHTRPATNKPEPATAEPLTPHCPGCAPPVMWGADAKITRAFTAHLRRTDRSVSVIHTTAKTPPEAVPLYNALWSWSPIPDHVCVA